MNMNIFKKEEKKVEYLELVYDLVFVYLIGRENAILHHFRDGFIEPGAFVVFLVSTLAVIQIWTFTTFYINLYGRNGARDHVFLLVNMYLIYFMGESTRNDWQAYQTQYHIAWGLIVLNVGLQYLLELRNHETDVWNRDLIRRMAVNLAAEAVFIFLAAVPNRTTGVLFSVIAILSGMILTLITRRSSGGGLVDFAHLSERAMLYVVFTFGEMIIAIAAYFRGDGRFHGGTIYVSLMTFLVVVGLFLSYEVIYDHLIDREGDHAGMRYMLIHIFIIFAMNCITVSFEIMEEERIAAAPKIMMITISMAAYFLSLFLLRGHFRPHCAPDRPFLMRMGLLTVGFVIAMIILRNNMYANLLVSVLYVFGVALLLCMMRAVREDRKRKSECGCSDMSH
ncbi:low temperature requirement protein A [Eubacterium pyruvativorans]|uniref:low temperature requirement protein A n=1 Tax=Eubacterium pyruvativorans TaxID=155865 RepID=UPI003F8A1E94